MSPVIIKTGSNGLPSYSSAPSESYAGGEDGFSVSQAFQDWYHLLIAPREFCDEQEGASGMLSPLALILAYSLLNGVFYLFALLVSGGRLGMGGIFGVFLVVLVVPATWLFYIVFCLVWGGLLHLCALVFGGRGAYSGSFRAAVYTLAPCMIMWALGSGLSLAFVPHWLDHSPPETTLFQVVGHFAGFVWGIIVLGMSIRATQRMTIGGAIGTTVVGAGLMAGVFLVMAELLSMFRATL